MRARRASMPACTSRSQAWASKPRWTISGNGAQRLARAPPAPARGLGERGDERVAQRRQDQSHRLETYHDLAQRPEPIAIQPAGIFAPRRRIADVVGEGKLPREGER